jgi:uncharacterized protein YceH (UPF0502 family)
MIELTSPEERVLGCLLEKQRTTPDTYPLTLNAIRLACNQATNRDPVVDYSEEFVHDTLQSLHAKGLSRVAGAHGSRVTKYRHLLEEELGVSNDEAAVICVLLLRGAQTPGELKTRTERLHKFDDLEDLEDTLEALTRRGLVQRLERRPGEKQARFRHLFAAAAGDEMPLDESTAGPGRDDGATGDYPSAHQPSTGPIASPEAAAAAGEVAELRAEISALRDEIARLRERVDRIDQSDALAEHEPLGLDDG